MAESPVVTGLVGKRAEFAGRIEACRRELEQLEADVGHLDGAIRLFAPDYKLEGIRAKPPGRRNRLFHLGGMPAPGPGDLPRGPGGASAGRLAEALAQRKGLEESAVIEQMRKNALGAVKRLAGKGVIAAAGTDGGGKTWRVC